MLQLRLRGELNGVYFAKVKQGSIGDRREYKSLGCEQSLANMSDRLCLEDVIRRIAMLLTREIRISTLGTELVTKCPLRIPQDAHSREWFIEATRSGNNDLPNMKASFHINDRGFSLRAQLLVAQGVQVNES